MGTLLCLVLFLSGKCDADMWSYFSLRFLHFCFHAALKFNISILQCTCFRSMGMSWHLRPCWWLRVMPQEDLASGTPVVTMLESEFHDVAGTVPTSVACTCGHGILQTESAIEGYFCAHDTNRARGCINVWHSSYHQRQCSFLWQWKHAGWVVCADTRVHIDIRRATSGTVAKPQSVFVALHLFCSHQGQMTTQKSQESYGFRLESWDHTAAG